MPIYEFVCQDCGHEFELIQSFSDNATPQCPICYSEQVMRRVGRPAIHFKGSGWYITDSKKASKSSANGQNGKDGAEQPAEKPAPSADRSADGKTGEGKNAAAKSGEGKSVAPSASTEKP